MVAKLPAMTSRHRHLCNPRRVCAKRNLKRKNLIFWSLSVKPVYFPTIGTVFSYMPRAFIIIINPLTARVVGAPQMILQPVFFLFFPVFHCPLGLAELHAYPFPDVVFPPLPLSALSSSPFHCALHDDLSQT